MGGGGGPEVKYGNKNNFEKFSRNLQKLNFPQSCKGVESSPKVGGRRIYHFPLCLKFEMCGNNAFLF